MKEITMKDINITINYDDLTFFKSHVMHDLKRLGIEKFIEKYDKYDHYYDEDEANRFLLALLTYLDKKDRGKYPFDTYVIDSRDYLLNIKEDVDLSEVNDRFKIALPEFLKYGFIYSEVEDAV